MTNLFLNKYRIDSTRATWHDYTDGIYFVTICTAQKFHYLGEIDTNNTKAEIQMHLSPIGQCAAENLLHISEHYPYAEIPLFVIMPNHIHAVIVIDNDALPHKKQNDEVRLPDLNSTTAKGNRNQQGKLSVVVGGIKSAVSRWARSKQMPFAWQSRYHDHIVRHQDELSRIAEYIEHNVANWYTDELYY